MRLYLSSYGLGDHPEKLLELLDGETRTAVVSNAADFHTAPERAERVERNKAMFEPLGIKTDELDLRDYFDDHEALKKLLKSYDMIWLRGGNTFILQRAITASGFDKAIKPMLLNNEIVYGGYSAGACVAARSLKGLDLVDDPTEVPSGYEPKVPWHGMSLVDYSIAPHYQSDHHESADIDRVVTYFLHHSMSYKPLRDGEVIVVDGEKEYLLG